MKTVITGATGFLGTALVPALRGRGDDIVVLTRDAAKARERLGEVEAVVASLETPGPWAAALAGADAVIHLAGEPIAGKRWNARQKQILRESRVEATRGLVEAIASLPVDDRPRALIAASGVDYYPFAPDRDDFDDDQITEASPGGETFLARLCRDWEHESMAAERLGVRVACMRTGIMLGPGGAVAKMTTPFKLFVGGRIGSGRQFFSWIHRDDAVVGYASATVDPRYRGPINLVAGSVRNFGLARALGEVLHRPSWLPVPGFALKAAVGELSEYMLHGRNVVPAKLESFGFAWTLPDLADALAENR